MTRKEPVAELDVRFSSPGAAPTPWAEARRRLEKAELYWLSTVKPDGRPHVTPLISIWLDGSPYFCTGSRERKAKNLEGNAHCALTTGCDTLNTGLDLVVEGDAVKIRDDSKLQRIADVYVAKYGPEWIFTVKDGAFLHGDGGVALVYEVRLLSVFAFGKGHFSQTRWRF